MTIDNLDDIRADWDVFSDRVMGGISEVYFYEMDEGNKNFYRLEGNVSTENNGGFIQSVARIKDINEEYKGIRMTVRGLRINIMFGLGLQRRFHGTDILLVLLQAKMVNIEVPFGDFKKSNFYMRKKMNISRIKLLHLQHMEKTLVLS